MLYIILNLHFINIRLFEPNEIAAIRQIRLYDVMIAATGIQPGNIQQNAFTWKQGRSIILRLNIEMKTYIV